VPAGDKIALAPAVWVDYGIYLHNLGTGPAYYAITEDGLGGAPSGCSLTKCLAAHAVPGKTGATIADALQRCEEVSPPSRTCIIFAEGNKIVVPYELREY
jgi:hypothetical protein